MYLNLKVSIWQSGMRQNRLAQTLSMDEALLSRIINGFREPTAEQRTRIAQLLQRDEAWLFARDAGAPVAGASDADARPSHEIAPIRLVARGESEPNPA